MTPFVARRRHRPDGSLAGTVDRHAPRLGRAATASATPSSSGPGRPESPFGAEHRFAGVLVVGREAEPDPVGALPEHVETERGHFAVNDTSGIPSPSRPPNAVSYPSWRAVWGWVTTESVTSSPDRTPSTGAP